VLLQQGAACETHVIVYHRSFHFDGYLGASATAEVLLEGKSLLVMIRLQKVKKSYGGVDGTSVLAQHTRVGIGRATGDGASEAFPLVQPGYGQLVSVGSFTEGMRYSRGEEGV
jgi:hypothetical protein